MVPLQVLSLVTGSDAILGAMFNDKVFASAPFPG
jgi:hypothetical protein